MNIHPSIRIIITNKKFTFTCECALCSRRSGRGGEKLITFVSSKYVAGRLKQLSQKGKNTHTHTQININIQAINFSRLITNTVLHSNWAYSLWSKNIEIQRPFGWYVLPQMQTREGREKEEATTSIKYNKPHSNLNFKSRKKATYWVNE